MRFAGYIFTTPGIGGMLVLVAVGVLLVLYGIAIKKWIIGGPEQDSAQSPKLDPHFPKRARSRESEDEIHLDEEIRVAHVGADRPEAA